MVGVMVSWIVCGRMIRIMICMNVRFSVLLFLCWFCGIEVIVLC